MSAGALRTTPVLARVFCLLSYLTGVSCQNQVPRDNPNDAAGTGHKNPGRIAGKVLVEGTASPGQRRVVIADDEGVSVDGGLTTTSDGSFISEELTPGTYSLAVEVPAENLPIELAGIAVLPGLTTDVGLLTSSLQPAVHQLTGVVDIEDQENDVALGGTHVVLTQIHEDGYAQVAVATTDAAGRYSFSRLRPGVFEIFAEREGFTPALTHWQITLARQSAEPAVMILYPASAVMRFSVFTPGQGYQLGAPFTRSRTVNLVMLAFGGVNEMRFSENPSFLENGQPLPWIPHNSELEVTLSAGEGQKTMYAQFRIWNPEPLSNPRGEMLRTETYRTTIVFDETPPTVLSFTLAPEALEIGGIRYMQNTDPNSVPVQVTAHDPHSWLDGVRIAVNAADPGSVLYQDVSATQATVSYASLVSLGSADGTKTVTLQLKDRAGNESDLVTATVVYDHTDPIVTVEIEQDAAWTNSSQVTLDITATDSNPLLGMYVSNSPTFQGALFQPYSATLSWAMPAPTIDEVKTVYVKVVDAGGNETSAEDTIFYDATPPDSAVVTIAPGSSAIAPGYTNEARVTLLLFAQGATTYKASRDPADLIDDTGAAAMGASFATAWFCIEGGSPVPGPCTPLPANTSQARTVFVRFFDALGNGSAIAQGTVFVDNQPPVGEGITVPAVGTATQVDGVNYTRSAVLTVAPTVVVPASEAAPQMRLKTDLGFDSETWLEFAPMTTVVLSDSNCVASVCHVDVQYRDLAGNPSATASASVVLDQTPPVGPRVVVASDIVSSTSYEVLILPNVVFDDHFLRFELQGAQYPTFASSQGDMAAVPMNETSFAFDLNANQANTLRIRAVDKAGNVSADDFVLVVHDSRRPAQPTGVKIAAFDQRLRATWRASMSDDVIHYRVHYGSIPSLYNGSGASEGISPINVGLNTSFNLTGLSNGNEVFISVTAVDAAGNESILAAEQSGVPSVMAPRLVSQIGGPIDYLWCNDSTGEIYVPQDGGLQIVSVSGGTVVDVTFLPGLPDPTQVLFDNSNGWVFVHSSDPALGPVDQGEVEPAFSELPNPEAPVRVLTTYRRSDWQEMGRLPLRDHTLFFELVHDGVATLGVSVTNGFAFQMSQNKGGPQKLILSASEMTLWSYSSTTGLFAEQGTRMLQDDAVAGYAIIDSDSKVVLGTGAVGTYDLWDFVSAGGKLQVFDPFAGAAASPLVSVTANVANDGIALGLGRMKLSSDYLFHRIDNAEGLGAGAVTTVVTDPSAPVIHGHLAKENDQDAILDPLVGTVADGDVDWLHANDAAFAFTGSCLRPPALIGHTLKFDSAAANPDAVVTIVSYQQVLGDANITIQFAPDLPTPVAVGDGFQVKLDQTDQQRSLLLPDPVVDVDPFPAHIELKLLAADPTTHKVFVIFNVPHTDDQEEIEYWVNEYGVSITATSESATWLSAREFSEKPTKVLVYPSYLIVLTSSKAMVFPRSAWSTAPGLEIQLDSNFRQFVAKDGYVYAAAAARAGASRLSVVDVTDPDQPKTVARVNTTAPVVKMAVDGNRLYVLQGECQPCEREPDVGHRNCGCSNQYLATYTLAADDLSDAGSTWAGASARRPQLVNEIALTGTGIDDLLPRKRDLLLLDHANDGSGYSHLERRNGQLAGQLPGLLVQSLAFPSLDYGTSYDGEDVVRFGLAAVGNYVFVGGGTSVDEGWCGHGGISAHLLTGASAATISVGESDGCYNTNDETRDLAIMGVHLYAFKRDRLDIYDISQVVNGSNDDASRNYAWDQDGPNIEKIGSWRVSTTWDQEGLGGTVAGPYAYFMTSASIRIIDVTSPTTPTEVSRMSVEPIDVQVAGGFLYVTTLLDGLRIYELARSEAFRRGVLYASATDRLSWTSRGQDLLFGRGEANESAASELIGWHLQTRENGHIVLPYFVTGGAGLSAEHRTLFGDDELWTQGHCSSRQGRECLAVYDLAYLGPDPMPMPAVIPAHCNNDLGPGDGEAETDWNCGWECAPCDLLRNCLGGEDCKSGQCEGGACVSILNDRAKVLDDPFSVESLPITPTHEGNLCSSSAECCPFQRCESPPFNWPEHCQNGQLDNVEGETDFDCGGPCRPCWGNSTCLVGSDCAAGSCTVGICDWPLASCSNGMQDGTETAIDCGGTDCPKCDAGSACVLGSDCLTGYCHGDHRCSLPPICRSSERQIFKVVRGAGTEYFALVRNRQMWNNNEWLADPNDGVYTFVHQASYAQLNILPGLTHGVLAGQAVGTCELQTPDVGRIHDMVWHNGILYLVGSKLTAMRATNRDAGTFLDWGSAHSTDDGSGEMCLRSLQIHGEYLYALGEIQWDGTYRCYFSSDDQGGLYRGGRALYVFKFDGEPADPMAPEFQTKLIFEQEQPRDFVVHGNAIYLILDWPERVNILDISNRTAPALVGAFDVPGGGNSIDAYGEQIYLRGAGFGMQTIDGR